MAGHWLYLAAEQVKIEVFNFADPQLSIVPKEFIHEGLCVTLQQQPFFRRHVSPHEAAF